MSASPKYKVYNKLGTYVASCKHAEDAACLCAQYGAGATVRLRHHGVLWTEGDEAFPASESYDGAAKIIMQREGGP